MQGLEKELKMPKGTSSILQCPVGRSMWRSVSRERIEWEEVEMPSRLESGVVTRRIWGTDPSHTAVTRHS